MRYDYAKAVDEIERRYPLERIAASRPRPAATWHLQRPPNAIPFVFLGFPDSSGVDGGALYEGRYPREELLAYQLEQILRVRRWTTTTSRRCFRAAGRPCCPARTGP